MIYCKGELMVEYEVVDTMGGHSLGKFSSREKAIYEIRLYCVQRMMNKISLFDQDFVTLLDNGDHVIYENPIGYFPVKPKFLINLI
tara:strand:- start:1042 stop:1299 length:258 start_codon:yes stop_codon:yes gene_type:complete